MNPAAFEEPLAAAAPWGCYEFYTLCDDLKETHPWLYAVVYRGFATSDWVAEIRTFPAGDGRSQNIASAQGKTMDEAAAFAVVDFYNRERIRQEELQQNPEALQLFGHQAK
jgi:hypothetical protein